MVNITRGSVVDTAALGTAIHLGKLGGAGLDVYESESGPPTGLLDPGQVVLMSHIAGWLPESVQAMADRFLENAHGRLTDTGVVSPAE